MQNTIIFFLLAAVTVAAAGLLLLTRGGMTQKQRKMMERIFLSAAILLVLQWLSPAKFNALDRFLFSTAGRWIRLGCYLANYILIGGDILRKAGKGIRNRRVFDENFLMALATVGAMALAIYENGDYLEAIAVMLFYQIGEWFQSYALGKSRRSITELMDIRPDCANVEQDGILNQVDPEEVAVGTVITVQPGEKIPIDGVVVEGHSSLNTSALTGESCPREVDVGAEVISGCVSMTGVLKIRTTRDFSESTVSKILELVENASSRKSRQEQFISRFARVYTPAVCYSALALAVLPPVLRLALGQSGQWGVWLYRALSFLVISCPCALVISIPLSFFAGIGGASSQGILIKGSNYLEMLAGIRQVVLDKTGTVTRGVFEVTEVCPVGISREMLLESAALAESASSHPISKSLRRSWGKEIDRQRLGDIQEIGGEGVIAMVDGHPVAVGNARLMARQNITCTPDSRPGTVVHVAIDGVYAGTIRISDVLKPTAKAAMEALRQVGVKKIVMLTGDGAEIARQTAGELGMDQVFSELLPGDKVAKVEELLAENRGGLAFVGDGINDAPVLSRADIGIAMGAMGSDAAIEAADIVLMDDDPMKIAKAIRISRKCMAIVRENIVLALTVKFICLALTALGIGNMYLAIFADVGVMVLAVLNAIRCLFVAE